MTVSTFDQVLARALTLSLNDRVKLLERLIGSFNKSDLESLGIDDPVQWLNEWRERIEHIKQRGASRT